MLAPSFFDHLQDRLNLAVYDINQDYRMGVAHIKEALRHIPGISDLTMTYGNGGATEIYTMGDVEVEVPAMATHEQIAHALQNPFDNPKKKLKAQTWQ